MRPRLDALAVRAPVHRRRPRSWRHARGRDRRARHRSPAPAEAARISAACHAAGVVTLTCGTYGNVLRFLPPLVITEDLLADALDVIGSAVAG